MAMNQYHVVWKIDVWANSHEEAARNTLRIQRDPDSTATVFGVRVEGSKEIVQIDLDRLDNPEGKRDV